MKQVLVTGTKGFIGAALKSELQSAGFRVVGVDRPKADIASPRALSALDRKNFVRVFHLAGKMFVPESWKDPAAFYRVNTMGTLHVLEYCRKTGTPLTFVSAYIYGQPEKLPISEGDRLKPNNPYAHSKFLAEELCRFYAHHFGLPVTIIRPFNVYGSGQKEHFLIPQVIRQASRSHVIHVDSLSPKRDYVHVKDMARALRLTLKNRRGLHVYNIGSGRSHSVKEVVESLSRRNGRLRIVSTGKRRRNEISNTVADIRLAARELGWKPKIQFKEGMRRLAHL